MKIREQAIKEIANLGPLDVLKVYDLILEMKEQRAEEEKNMGTPPYLKVRKALQDCKGSFSDDVLAEREDRI